MPRTPEHHLGDYTLQNNTTNQLHNFMHKDKLANQDIPEQWAFKQPVPSTIHQPITL